MKYFLLFSLVSNNLNMEEDILNYLPIVMFRGTPIACIQKTKNRLFCNKSYMTNKQFFLKLSNLAAIQLLVSN